MSSPLVSICVPTYNGAQYLEACLASAVAQTHPNVEILVVDDGSSDGTVSIVRRYADGDPRVRLLQNRHRLGLVGNWNRCVDLARGEWLKFLFQDDMLAPACVERMLAGARASGRPMAVCDREIVFEDVPEETRRFYAPYQSKESPAGVFPRETDVAAERFSDACLEHLRHNFVGEPTSMLLHSSVFERFGRFNADLIAVCDVEYWMRVGVNAGLVRVPEVLASFRVHMLSTSAANAASHEYRMTALDPAIFLHELAFHPAFAPLRAAAARRRPPMDLRRMFAEQANQAQHRARSSRGTSGTPDALEEWRGVVAAYPRVERSLPVMMLQLRRTPRRVLRRLARQVVATQ